MNSTLNTDSISVAIFTYYICKMSTTAEFLKEALIIQNKLVREMSLSAIPCFICLATAGISCYEVDSLWMGLQLLDVFLCYTELGIIYLFFQGQVRKLPINAKRNN